MNDTSNYKNLLKQIEEENKRKDKIQEEKFQQFKTIQQLSREIREHLNVIDDISDHVELEDLDNEELWRIFLEQANASQKKSRELLNKVIRNSTKKFSGALRQNQVAEILDVSAPLVWKTIHKENPADQK